MGPPLRLPDWSVSGREGTTTDILVPRPAYGGALELIRRVSLLMVLRTRRGGAPGLLFFVDLGLHLGSWYVSHIPVSLALLHMSEVRSKVL